MSNSSQQPGRTLSRRHRRRPRALPFPGGDHPGRPCPLHVLEILQLDELDPFPFPYHTGRCWTCSRQLLRGDTCSSIPAHTHAIRLICYECLTGINVFNGYHTASQAARLSPFLAAQIDAPYVDRPPDRAS